MAVYRAAGIRVQTGVFNALSGSISSVVNRQLPDNIPVSSDNYVEYSSKQLLSGAGLQVDNIGYANSYQATLVNNALDASKSIVGKVVDGSLTDRNYQDFYDYEANDARQFYDSADGVISRSVNTLYDTFSSLSLDNQVDRRLFNPGYTIASDDNSISNMARPVFSEDSGKIGTLTSASSWTDPLIDYQPKFKYLYIVEFNLYPEYQNDVNTDFTFLAYKFDKPKISINYEDVNFYNFRSQVPIKTTFSTMALEIHDDIKNASMNFLVSYLRRVSPVFNQDINKNRDFFESSGMNFDDATSTYGLYTLDNNINIIESIKVYHIYNANKTMDVHIFNNPKLSEVNLHDFDMSAGESGCSISLEFVFDNYSINTGETPQIPGNKLAINELSSVDSEYLGTLGSMWASKYTELNRSSSDVADKTNNDPLSSNAGLDYNVGASSGDYQSIMQSLKQEYSGAGNSQLADIVSNDLSNYSSTKEAAVLKNALSLPIDPKQDVSGKLTLEQINILKSDISGTSIESSAYNESMPEKMNNMTAVQNNQPVPESYMNVQSLTTDAVDNLKGNLAGLQ